MSYFKTAAIPFVLFVGVLLSSCQKDNDPRAIITVQVDANYNNYTGKVDRWIFATDATGEVLDVRPYSAGQTVTLISAKAVDKINVTTVLYQELPGVLVRKYTNLNTFADIPVGTTLHLERETPVDPGPEATAHLSITNMNGSSVQLANGLQITQHPSPDFAYGFDDLPFYGAPSDMLIASYRSGVPVYSWVKGLKDGDVVSLDFQTDFIPHPRQIILDFEGRTSGTTSGRNAAGKWYYMSDSYYLTNTSPEATPVIGFLDGFESYSMELVNLKANGWVRYYKRGPFNLSPTIPTFTFTFGKTSFLDYAFNFSQDYTTYTVGWGYSDGLENVNWDLSAPSGTIITKLNIPDEIAAKYPNLDVSRFGSPHISFTHVLQGRLPLMPGEAEVSDNIEMYEYTPGF